MKKLKNKKSIFIIIFLLIISSTVAYLYSTDTFQNIFVAASYKVTVVETFESPNNWKPGDTTPKTVTLKNEGTVPIKVRVKLEEEWKDSNNQDLPLQYNDENVAIINYSNLDDYIYKDGYYYYDLALEPGETTSSIIESVTFNPNYSGTITCVENNDNTHNCSSSDSGYEGGTYKLTITIEGVQEDYYVQAWGLPDEIFRPTFYNVLKRETENNGLAKEYTGEHHDSFTEEPSQKIYHWYASNSTEASKIKNKHNLIFGGHCWQMIRTTDTGGVKVIYNGDAVDNKCLSTRGNHVGYNGYRDHLSGDNKWYGTDFTYDPVNKVFKLSGDLENSGWFNIRRRLIGKYTCLSGNQDATCSTLYLVQSIYSTSSPNLISISSSASYNSNGKLRFNDNHFSLASVGYMYGDEYLFESHARVTNKVLNSTASVLSNLSLSTTYWYADSISYDNSTNRYSLVNPYQISSANDYPNLVGKYTFGSSNQNNTANAVYYIYEVNTSSAICDRLISGRLSPKTSLVIGDSITDNNDGTYSLNNPVTLSLSDWNSNYENYYHKYSCDNNSTICTSPRLITRPINIMYDFVDASEEILLGKGRNGLTLTNTILVRLDQIMLNPDDYIDYKYTCGTTSSVCTESNLGIIDSFERFGYSYAPNHYFGSSVTWDGEKYTLVDPIEIENYNNLNSISTHHFICPDYGEKECSTVYYIYYSYLGNSYMYTVRLEKGNIFIENVLNDMLKKNNKDSIMKIGIEAWYKHYLLDYDDYIEDTIYCNDRSISNLNGWNPNGGMTNRSLEFRGSALTTDLSCENITDQFSVSNSSAPLQYKVGLLTIPEVRLFNGYNLINVNDTWLMSPYFEKATTGSVGQLNSSWIITSNRVQSDIGFRLVISLKPGVEYESGDGSMANPYIVKMD